MLPRSVAFCILHNNLGRKRRTIIRAMLPAEQRKERIYMELTEITGLTEEQIEQVKRYAQGCEDRVRTDYSKQLKDVRAELDKYKPVEKSETEKDLEARLSKIEAREKELTERERQMTISSKLKEKGLPSDLAQYLNIGEDIDKSIDGVNTVLASVILNNGNKPTTHTTNQRVTKADFRKMSYGERAKLFRDNPELYKLLAK